MRGGFINCDTKINRWERERFNRIGTKNTSEAEALNNLGICRIGFGTDNYFKNEPNLINDWYINSKPYDKKNIREILYELKNNNIENLKKDKKNYKNYFEEPLKLLEKEINYRKRDVSNFLDREAITKNEKDSEFIIKSAITHDEYILYLEEFKREIKKFKNEIEKHIKKKRNINKENISIKNSSKSIKPNFSLLEIEGYGNKKKRKTRKNKKSKKKLGRKTRGKK